MEKFGNLQYTRPNFEEITEKLKKYIEQLKKTESYEQANALFLEQVKMLDEMSAMYTIASIRNSVDTRNQFYEDEMNAFYEFLPNLELVEKDADNALLASPFVEQFKAEYGENFIRGLEASQKLSDESIVEDKIEESKLSQEYTKITANATAIFRGEDCNFYGLLKHMESTDRNERREAFEAWAALYEKISPQLDDIYSRLVELRASMAQKLGFESYVDMAYLSNRHYYYTAADVAKFREQIVKDVVPAVTELYARQQKHIGVDRLYFYDEKLVWKEGNATPIGNKDELVQKAQDMYSDMSKESKEFFEFMVENDLFDLETRAGKQMGGYCTMIDGYGAPFIFSNFNGTSADVDVLTHEAGHAFQAYTTAKNCKISSQIWATSELAEINSMTMEQFAYPYMDSFFGENADKYRYAHLAESLKILPYLCLVDHYQHEVFASPKMTATERRACWRRLEKVYMPWRDYDGNKFLEEGGFWMQKMHIFLYPFYYVDYAMAQMAAYELYTRSLTDKKQAWEDYYALCKVGGMMTYFDTLSVANLSDPFAKDTVQKVTAPIIEKLLSSDY